MRIALAQILVDMDDRPGNIRRAKEAIASAAAVGADLVGLPECLDMGWLNERDIASAEPIGGPLTRALSASARKFGVWVVAGMVEKADEHTYNTAVVFNRSGELVHRHRKICVLGIAGHLYHRGSSLGVVETEFGRLGVHICADAFGPGITGALAEMGAKVVVSPCAWACDRGDEDANIQWLSDRYRERTSEKDIYLVGIDGVGKVTQGVWSGKILRGSSLVYGLGGEELLRGPTSEQALLIVDLPLHAEAAG